MLRPVALGSVVLALAAAPAAPRPVSADLGFTSVANGLRYRCVSVPHARGVAAVLSLPIGTEHDPAGKTGLAHLIAEWMRSRESERSPREQLQVEVRGSSTLVTGLGTSRSLADLLGRLRELVSAELEPTADEVQLAAGRAALAADDHSKVVPGPCLDWLVARSLFAGTPAGRQGVGVVSELRTLRLEHAFVAGWFRDHYRPRGARLVVVGPDPAEAMDAAVAGVFGDLAPGEVPLPEPTVHDSLGEPMSEIVQDRVAAPFVTLAVPAPDSAAPEYLEFAVAMQVVGRLGARFFRRYRGQEAAAKFPIFVFAHADASPVARINRRGKDGQEAEEVIDEIEDFVAVLLDRGVLEDELELAKATVARGLLLPPFSVDPGGLPHILAQRARTLLVADRVGWPADIAERVGSVTADGVQKALRTALSAGERRYLALLPRP